MEEDEEKIFLWSCAESKRVFAISTLKDADDEDTEKDMATMISAKCLR